MNQPRPAKLVAPKLIAPKLMALSGIALLALTACGNDSSSASSSSSSTTTSSAQASSTPTDSMSPMDSASPMDSSSPMDSATPMDSSSASPMASASSSTGSTASGIKNYTNASLAAVLPKVSVNGVAFEALPSAQLDQVAKQIDSIGTVMKQASVTPAACKTASLSAMEALKADKAMAIGGSDKLPAMAVVRAEASPEAAAKAIALQKSTAAACKSYTMKLTTGGQTINASSTNTIAQVDAASVENDLASDVVTKVQGKTTKQNTVMGTVGNLVIQVTSTSGATDKQLVPILESVGKAYAADMAG